jgi:hypothetical protein
VASNLSSSAALLSISAGDSAAVAPIASAGTKTQGLAASIMLTATRPTPGTCNVSVALPVGSNLPVLAPPGSMNSSRIGAPVPATPSSAISPETAASPPSSANLATMIFRVFVLWMRTTAGPSVGLATSPSSMANGPIADDMFPQLLL